MSSNCDKVGAHGSSKTKLSIWSRNIWIHSLSQHYRVTLRRVPSLLTGQQKSAEIFFLAFPTKNYIQKCFLLFLYDFEINLKYFFSNYNSFNEVPVKYILTAIQKLYQQNSKALKNDNRIKIMMSCLFLPNLPWNIFGKHSNEHVLSPTKKIFSGGEDCR